MGQDHMSAMHQQFYGPCAMSVRSQALQGLFSAIRSPCTTPAPFNHKQELLANPCMVSGPYLSTWKGFHRHAFFRRPASCWLLCCPSACTRCSAVSCFWRPSFSACNPASSLELESTPLKPSCQEVSRAPVCNAQGILLLPP